MIKYKFFHKNNLNQIRVRKIKYYELNNLLFIAFLKQDVCFLGFINSDYSYDRNLIELSKRFKGFEIVAGNPNDKFIKKINSLLFSPDGNSITSLKLQKDIEISTISFGTKFQINVWKEITKIETGNLKTYKEIAVSIQKPKASLAVGSACSANFLAYLIPCHRVISSDKKLISLEYRWGENQKKILLQKEGVIK